MNFELMHRQIIIESFMGKCLLLGTGDHITDPYNPLLKGIYCYCILLSEFNNDLDLILSADKEFLRYQTYQWIFNLEYVNNLKLSANKA